MAGDKSTIELSAEYNVDKSTISEWVKKYGEECQYTNTTSKSSESESAKEIRRLNQMLKEKDKVWCTDFTYMHQPRGKFRYNCTIIDLYDCSAVASVNSNYINTDLSIGTLVKAVFTIDSILSFLTKCYKIA